uniref:Uncharacterized protein n=1 Tax=Ralstonia solanacearum TaxID=305 RepID=A0A0S4UGM3_RALSL|nr:protein of unknown function [Ralstonia solanacearum]
MLDGKLDIIEEGEAAARGHGIQVPSASTLPHA